MSLKSKITAAVNKAFSAAGDLVQTGTLSSKSVSDYSFSSRSTVSTSSSQSVSVIIEATDKKSGEGFNYKAVMKSGINLSVYDTLVIGNATYNILDFNDNDFVIEASLVKEV